MNAEDSLSGFQDCLIQLIINDRSNKKIKKEKKTISDGTRTLNLHRGTPWETDTVTTRPFLHLEMNGNEYRVSKEYYVTCWWTTTHVFICVLNCACQCIVYKCVPTNTHLLDRSLAIGWRKKLMKSWKSDLSFHFLCLSVCLYACLSVYLSVCLSVCMPVYMSVCLSTLSVCLSLYLSLSLPLSLPHTHDFTGS